MKYLVFWVSLAGVPFLAWFLSLNHRWIRWTFYGMVAGLCMMGQTAVNFLSHESHRGSARGIEIALVHLLALVVVGALAYRGKWQRPFPEGGIRLYALYFLLCLPSLLNADNALFGLFEVWKMLLLFIVWHAVYGFLAATGDVKTVVKSLAFFTLANFWSVLSQHYGGIHMARGVFTHRNAMAMAVNLLGPLFFAGYLQMGLRTRLGWLCTLAFSGAALSAMWSYSRGAIAVVPVGYALAAMASVIGNWRTQRLKRVLARMAPILLAGLAGLVAIWPNLVARFTVTGAKHSSKDTRVALAWCAAEMMIEHPWAGVGINNWSLNMSQTEHPYVERASERLDRGMSYKGVVETVYLLVGAECGIPALLAMLVWFAWHGVACLVLVLRLRGSPWQFVPAGLLGGFVADGLQSTLEWVLRQKLNMILLLFCFALVAHLRLFRHPAEEGRA